MSFAISILAASLASFLCGLGLWRLRLLLRIPGHLVIAAFWSGALIILPAVFSPNKEELVWRVFGAIGAGAWVVPCSFLSEIPIVILLRNHRRQG